MSNDAERVTLAQARALTRASRSAASRIHLNRRQFLAGAATTLPAAQVSAAQLEPVQDDVDTEPQIRLSDGGRQATIRFADAEATLDATVFGRDGRFAGPNRADETITLTIENVYRPRRNRPAGTFTVTFTLKSEPDGSWTIDYQPDGLTSADPWSSNRAVDLQAFLAAEVDILGYWDAPTLEGFARDIFGDVFTLEHPSSNRPRGAVAVLSFSADALLGIRARGRWFFRFAGMGATATQFSFAIDPDLSRGVQPEPADDPAPVNDALAAERQTVDLEGKSRRVLIFTNLKLQNPLLIGATAPVADEASHLWLMPAQEDAGAVALSTVAVLPFYDDRPDRSWALKLEATTEDETAERSDDAGEHSNALEFWLSDNASAPTARQLAAVQRGDDGVLQGPFKAQFAWGTFWGPNSDANFGAVPALNFSFYRNDGEDYTIHTRAGPVLTAFPAPSQDEPATPEPALITMHAIDSLLVDWVAKVPVRTVFPTVFGTDFSHFSGAESDQPPTSTLTDLRLRGVGPDSAQSLDNADNLAGYASTAPLGTLLLGQTSVFAIPLDPVMLHIRRAADLASLSYRFRHLVLALDGQTHTIRPVDGQASAASELIAEDQGNSACARSFPALSNAIKPALIVQFPPQHIAERVYFRTTRDGSLPPEQALPSQQTPPGQLSLAELPDVDLGDLPRNATAEDMITREITKCERSKDYMFFKIAGMAWLRDQVAASGVSAQNSPLKGNSDRFNYLGDITYAIIQNEGEPAAARGFAGDGSRAAIRRLIEDLFSLESGATSVDAVLNTLQDYMAPTDYRANYLGEEHLFHAPDSKLIELSATESITPLDVARFAARRLVLERQENRRDEAFKPLTWARQSGPSRIAFHIAARQQKAPSVNAPGSQPDETGADANTNDQTVTLPFTFDGLTDWRLFDLIVPRRAESFEAIATVLQQYSADDNVPVPDTNTDEPAEPTDPETSEEDVDLRMQEQRQAFLEFQGICKADETDLMRDQVEPVGRKWQNRMADIQRVSATPPRPYETSIEVPFRMHLSPESGVVIETPQQTVDSGRQTPIPLWRAELHRRARDLKRGAADVRAVYSPDFEPGVFLQAGSGGEKSDLPDANALGKQTPEDDLTLLTTLNARDRHQLVQQSSVYGLPAVPRLTNFDTLTIDASQFQAPAGYTINNMAAIGGVSTFGDDETGIGFQAIVDPKPLGVKEMTLTSLGANLDLDASFEPASPPFGLLDDQGDGSQQAGLYQAMSIERWRHTVALGRDIETEVVYKGFLFPLGLRASLVKLTQREFHNIPGDPHPRAFLIQRLFLKVGDPVKRFPAVRQQRDGRLWPVDEITLLTTRTAPLLDPTVAGIGDAEMGLDGFRVDPHGAIKPTDDRQLPGLIFWPRTEPGTAGNVRFEFTIDEFSDIVDCPYMFLDNTAANSPESVAFAQSYYNKLSDSEWGTRLAATRTGTKLSSAPAQTILAHNGTKRRYARENEPGDTMLKTYFWQLHAEGRSSALGLDGADRTHRMDDAAMQSADQPPFYPLVKQAQVVVQQIEVMTGAASPPAIAKFAERYENSGFDTVINPEECVLEFDKTTRPRLGFSNPNSSAVARGDRGGGIGQPNTEITQFCRRSGPSGDLASTPNPSTSEAEQTPNPTPAIDVSTTARGQVNSKFQLPKFFDTEAKLFNFVSFSQLLDLENLDAEDIPVLKEAVKIGTNGLNEANDQVDDLLDLMHGFFVDDPDNPNPVFGVIKEVYPRPAAALNTIQDILVDWKQDPEEQKPDRPDGVTTLTKLFKPIVGLIHEIKLVADNPEAPLRSFLDEHLLRRFQGVVGEFDRHWGDLIELLSLNQQELEALVGNTVWQLICSQLLTEWGQLSLGAPRLEDATRAAQRALENAVKTACESALPVGTPLDQLFAQSLDEVVRTRLYPAVEAALRAEAANLGGRAERQIEALAAEYAVRLNQSQIGRISRRAQTLWDQLVPIAQRLFEIAGILRVQPQNPVAIAATVERAYTKIENLVGTQALDQFGAAASLVGGYADRRIRQAASTFEVSCIAAAKVAQSLFAALPGDNAADLAVDTIDQQLGELVANIDAFDTNIIASVRGDVESWTGGLDAEVLNSSRQFLQNQIDQRFNPLQSEVVALRSAIVRARSQLQEPPILAALEALATARQEIASKDWPEAMCNELVAAVAGGATPNFDQVSRAANAWHTVSEVVRTVVRTLDDAAQQAGNQSQSALHTALSESGLSSGLDAAIRQDLTAAGQQAVDQVVDSLVTEVSDLLAPVFDRAIDLAIANADLLAFASSIVGAAQEDQPEVALSGLRDGLRALAPNASSDEDVGGVLGSMIKAIDGGLAVLNKLKEAKVQFETARGVLENPNSSVYEKLASVDSVLAYVPGGRQPQLFDVVRGVEKSLDLWLQEQEANLFDHALAVFQAGSTLALDVLVDLVDVIAPALEGVEIINRSIDEGRKAVVLKLGDLLRSDEEEDDTLIRRIFRWLFSGGAAAQDDEITIGDIIAKNFWVKSDPGQDVPDDLYRRLSDGDGNDGGPFSGDVLGQELQQLVTYRELGESEDEEAGLERAEALIELVDGWTMRETIAGIVLLNAVGDLGARLQSADLSDFLDFDALLEALEEFARSMVPSQIDVGYGFGLKFKDNQFIQKASVDTADVLQITEARAFVDGSAGSSFGLPQGLSISEFLERPGRNADKRLFISARTRVDVLRGGKPDVRVVALAKPFDLKLLGRTFDALTITFHGALFSMDQSGDMSFKTRIANVKLGSRLQFLDKLSKLFNPGKSGPYILPRFSPFGVEVGYKISVGMVPFGGLIISNIAFSAAVILPFDSSRAKFAMSLSSRNSPFLMSSPPFGGGGFVRIVSDAGNIESFEASMEFGGVVDFQFGPLVGQGRVTTGLYVRHGRQSTFIEGFFFAGGSARIACFGIAASLFVGLSHANGSMVGTAVFKFSFSVGFIDIEFGVNVAYQISGDKNSQDPKSTNRLTPQKVSKHLAFLFDHDYHDRHLNPDALTLGSGKTGSLDRSAKQSNGGTPSTTMRCNVLFGSQRVREALEGTGDAIGPTAVRASFAPCRATNWAAYTRQFDNQLLQPLEGL